MTAPDSSPSTPTAVGPGRPPFGLTLIEMLIALAVMGVLSVLGFRALETMSQGRGRLVQEADAQRSLTATWRWLARDLEPLAQLNRQGLRNGLVVLDQGFRLADADWRIEPSGLVRLGRDQTRLLLAPEAISLELWLQAANQPAVRLEPGRPFEPPPGPLALELRLAIRNRGVMSQSLPLGPGYASGGAQP